MCSIHQSIYQQPLSQRHVLPVANAYGLEFEKVQDIFESMTNWEIPEASVFVMIIDTLARFLKQEYGTGGDYGPWLPLSAITMDQEFARYRTPEMQVCHDGFLAFNMSQRNRERLNTSLDRNYQTQLVTRHSCGISIVSSKDVANELESEIHRVRNFLRSRANSIGTELVTVPSFDKAPSNIDMGPKEVEAYQRIWNILTSLEQYSEEGNQTLKNRIHESLNSLKAFHKQTQNIKA